MDWQLDDDMKSEIATRLIRADELSATDFSETVTALASKRVNDNYENCLRSIMANSQDHIFSELPEGGLEAQLVSLLTDSTAYLSRKIDGKQHLMNRLYLHVMLAGAVLQMLLIRKQRIGRKSIRS